MTKRILFAIGEMSGGGSQRQLLGILQHLDRSRFTPELYLIAKHGELLGDVPKDVPVHIFEQRKPTPASFLPGVSFRARVRDLRQLLESRRFDVVYDRTYHMTLITAPATARTNTPRVSVIVTDPRLDFETNPERFRFMKRRLLKKAYGTADRVLAVSEGVRVAAGDYYHIPPHKIETSYNLFDIAAIEQKAKRPLSQDLAFEESRFLIVAAGRLHVQKGFDVLIEAVRIAVHEMGRRELLVWILGTGGLESELKAQIQKGKLADHVKLLGFQDNPLPMISRADLFCLSSRYEGMPNALVEAMICGTPVLSTDCPSGPREILDGGELGMLVPVENPREMAKAMAHAASDPSRLRSILPAARKKIESAFGLKSGIDRLSGLLEEVSKAKR